MSDTDVIDMNTLEKIEKQSSTSPQAGECREKRTLHLSDIAGVASRLGKILAEETHYLSLMDFKAVAMLQNEKLKHISALEIQKNILKLDPTIKASFPKDEIAEFEIVCGMFDKILAENYQHLMRVKTVNQKVVDIVAKAVSGRTAAPTAYSKDGIVVPQSLSDMPLALSQNV